MKIVAPKKLIETFQNVFLPAPELDKFVRNNFLNEESKLYNEDHRHLLQAKIAYLWTNVPNRRGGRTIAATAELAKPPTMGGKWLKAKWEYQMEQWFGHSSFDFLITMNARIIATVDRFTAFAILDHELYHCGQEMDEFGVKQFSRTTGKPKFMLLGHDLEEFVGIWRRYGVQHGAGESVAMAAAAKGKPLISKAEIQRLCGNN